MTPKELTSNLANLTAEFERTRRELVEQLRPQFHGLFTETFETNPLLDRVVWTQYTPYFNDGDACEFSRGEFTFHSNIDREDDDDYYDDYEGDLDNAQYIQDVYGFYHNGSLPEGYMSWYKTDEDFLARMKMTKTQYFEHNAIQNGLTKENIGQKLQAVRGIPELRTALLSIPEDAYEMLFGDHVKVTVTRSGVDVSDYSHD